MTAHHMVAPHDCLRTSAVFLTVYMQSCTCPDLFKFPSLDPMLYAHYQYVVDNLQWCVRKTYVQTHLYPPLNPDPRTGIPFIQSLPILIIQPQRSRRSQELSSVKPLRSIDLSRQTPAPIHASSSHHKAETLHVLALMARMYLRRTNWIACRPPGSRLQAIGLRYPTYDIAANRMRQQWSKYFDRSRANH